MSEIENRPFDDIAVGDRESMVRTLTERDAALIAAAVDVDAGVLGSALFARIFAERLPGPGSRLTAQTYRYARAVPLGEEVIVEARVREKRGDADELVFECLCKTADGETIIEGEAVVIAARDKIRAPARQNPTAFLADRGERLRALIDEAKALPALKTAVAHPVEPVSLAGAVEAAREGLIAPILVGPRARIEALP